jgi:SAM-dependent methyltransferase
MTAALDCDWEAAIRFIRDLRLNAPSPGARLRPATPRVRPDEFIGFVPTPMVAVRRMLEMADIRSGETVYDLGSGDGRILISAARRYGARGVGIDIDPVRIEDGRRRAGPLSGRIEFRRQNIFRTDLRQADVVMLYLLPVLNGKLLPLLRGLKPGVRIVSHCFELPGIAARKTACVKSREGRYHRLFAYRTPLETLDQDA